MHEALARAKFDQDVANLSPAIAARLRLAINAISYPTLDITIQHSKPLRLAFMCDNWDDQPPSIRICEPDGTDWKQRLPGGIFNGGAHDISRKVFICMPGSREFHTHGSHVNERWDGFRGQPGKTLVGLVMQLAEAWRRQVN